MTMIRSYQDCVKLAATRKRKIDNNTYLIIEPPLLHEIDKETTYHIKLHNTNIITYHANGDVVLNAGGWRTVTTKARMNEYAPVSIWQAKGLWTVQYAGNSYFYDDGITINVRTGVVTGMAADPQAEIKLRKRVNAYVKDYMDAFQRGEVPPPSGGDCWGCCMKEVGTGKEVMGTDHLFSHMDEAYFVPSMLMNAMGDWAGTCCSQAAKQYVSYVWNQGDPKVATYLQGIAVPQLKKVLFDYLAHRLGLTPGRTMYRRAA
jgi:hypothetical protein